MRKIIIIGATSGIGRELAKKFSSQGDEIGIIGRREALLLELAKELPKKVYVRSLDIALINDATNQLEDLIKEMNGVDIVIISAGIGYFNLNLDWSVEQETIDTNVSGFAAMCNVAMKCFVNQGKGHLVGISSIDAINGNGYAPAYAASKSFVSNYLEGLSYWVHMKKLPINVTEIQPGFVDTRMAKGEMKFWVAPVEKAAEQIYMAIINKKTHAYITRRWCLIACVLNILPRWIIRRFYR
ncbi:MAG: fabG 2 [Firmicutes bacterium]|nr:fabG 2 [Bacillota bacterium]